MWQGIRAIDAFPFARSSSTCAWLRQTLWRLPYIDHNPQFVRGSHLHVRRRGLCGVHRDITNISLCKISYSQGEEEGKEKRRERRRGEKKRREKGEEEGEGEEM